MWRCAEEKFHFTPFHTLCQLNRDETLFSLLGRVVVSSEVPSDTWSQVWGVGKIWRPCDLQSGSYKRLYTHTRRRTQGNLYIWCSQKFAGQFYTETSLHLFNPSFGPLWISLHRLRSALHQWPGLVIAAAATIDSDYPQANLCFYFGLLAVFILQDEVIASRRSY